MTQKVTIGVGDLAISDRAGAELVTYSLGSCIAVMIHDPVVKVGGMLHLMLPDANLNLTRAKRQPGVFASSGIPILFRQAYKLGAQKGRMRVVVVGGSQVMDASGHFNIGKRNYAAVRKLFWRNNVLIDKEDIGGNVNRTVGLAVSTGGIWMKTNSGEKRPL